MYLILFFQLYLCEHVFCTQNLIMKQNEHNYCIGEVSKKNTIILWFLRLFFHSPIPFLIWLYCEFFPFQIAFFCVSVKYPTLSISNSLKQPSGYLQDDIISIMFYTCSKLDLNQGIQVNLFTITCIIYGRRPIPGAWNKLNFIDHSLANSFTNYSLN